MSYIHNKGNPTCPVWVVVHSPFKNDYDKGYIFSSGLGYVWDKMMKDAGFDDYYVTCRKPDDEHPETYNDVTGQINHYKPPIIFMLESMGSHYIPEMVPKRQGKNYNPDEDSEISKYCGSLMKGKNIKHDHYIIPTYGPETIARQWKQRDIVINCDLGKGFAELEFWRKNGILNPLPVRKCQIDFPDFDELLSIIDDFGHRDILSNDIETIYPRDKSKWKGLHPGLPVTIGLAPSRDWGISFELFRPSIVETRELWRRVNNTLKKTRQLGQNFFNFDAWFYDSLGFEINQKTVIDTMVRHHILWAELPHKLQFLGRQYTRQPYWKDEGAGWGIGGGMKNLKYYNCLDVCCTFEIYEEEEKEFDLRPWLR